VSGLTNGVSAIASSFDHTCALLTSGTEIKCWGKNLYGELGNGSLVNSAAPVSVSLPGSTVITNITAGAQHSCALTDSGSVLCWGDGALGQMGNGTTTQKNSQPQNVTISNVTSISSGGYADTGHTCAVTSTGAVKCWGSNILGQLGDGSNVDRSTPVSTAAFPGGLHAASVDVGVNHTCALMNDHSVECWGSDSSGQLGDGVNSISTTAIDVNQIGGGVTLLGTGERNTCALASGSVLCWGNNRSGQVSDGTNVNRPAPTPVAGLSGNVTAIDSGMNQSCAVVDSKVECWSWNNGAASLATVIPGGVSSLSVTNLHACAVVNSAAECWGDNSHGQLGNGATTDSSTPVVVSTLSSGVAAVSVGQWFSCALLTNQTVQCWGDNTNGQLGNGATATLPATVPVAVGGGLSGVTSITAGQDHACALTASGALFCWGNNQQGQLGVGDQLQRTLPAPVNGLASGVTQVTAGGYHTCALVSGGVKCWGFNSFGQLGNGLTTLSKNPVNVSGLTSGVKSVAAGGINYDEEQTCAITSAQNVKCWGGDEYGQLGDNLQISHTTPVHVLGLANGPEVGQNYQTGGLGSFFRMAAANFPASATLDITSNGKVIGAILTSSEGYAIFHIQANEGLSGPFTILSISGVTVTNHVDVNPADLTRSEEGSAPIYFLSPNPMYLPIISRN
jgi:alpha-tubulin suppressor-like RCC1 family protein